MNELKKIYLEPSGCACPKEGQMWCEDTQVCDNCEKPYTPYIRADLAVSIIKLEEAFKLVEDENIHIGERYYVLNKVLQKIIDDHKKGMEE